MIVSFVNGDGGAGKTTVLASLATILADRGLKILVIDITHKRSATRLFMDDREFGHDESVYGVLEHNQDLEVDRNILHTDVDGVDIVTGHQDLENLAGFQYEMFLREKLEGIADRYDHIFIDTANHGVLLNIAICSSEAILPVAKPTKDSLYGAIEVIERHNVLSDKHSLNSKVLEVILNQFKKGKCPSEPALTELMGLGASDSRFLFLSQYFHKEVDETTGLPEHVVQNSDIIPKLQFSNQNLGVVWGWLNASRQLKKIAEDIFM